jgi:hypothetical protein
MFVKLRDNRDWRPGIEKKVRVYGAQLVVKEEWFGCIVCPSTG